MPIFEFKCNRCKEKFEQLLIGNDKPVCKKCSSEDVVKQISICGFVSKNYNGATVAQSPSSCGTCPATSCGSCSS